jgi:hypothetical protein
MGVRATISEAVHRAPAELRVRPRHQSGGDLNLPLIERYTAIRVLEVNIGKDGILLEHEDAFDDASEAGSTFEVANLFRKSILKTQP